MRSLLETAITNLLNSEGELAKQDFRKYIVETSKEILANLRREDTAFDKQDISEEYFTEDDLENFEDDSTIDDGISTDDDQIYDHDENSDSDGDEDFADDEELGSSEDKITALDDKIDDIDEKLNDILAKFSDFLDDDESYEGDDEDADLEDNEDFDDHEDFIGDEDGDEFEDDFDDESSEEDDGVNSDDDFHNGMTEGKTYKDSDKKPKWDRDNKEREDKKKFGKKANPLEEGKTRKDSDEKSSKEKWTRDNENRKGKASFGKKGGKCDDLAESILDELEKIDFDCTDDDKLIGDGGKFDRNVKEMNPTRKTDAKPSLSKPYKNDSFDRETPPKSDVRKKAKFNADKMEPAKKPGSTLLGSDFAKSGK